MIVATLNRVTELERLLASLDRQSYKDFEVIVVDQNPDDRLVPLLRSHDSLTIRHLRSGRGLSRARNVGLSVAKGDIIGFPDDDCWYPEQLLATVAEWFASHPEFGGLFTNLRDAGNESVGPTRPAETSRCTKENLWHCGLSPNAFLRRQVADAIGRFNENIGVGAASRYQSGEETDYFLRSLALGLEMCYEPSITVHHPSLHSLERLYRTTYTYALGAGHILRVHDYPWRYVSKRIIRSFGGAAVNLCKGNFRVAYAYLLRTAGQLRGYILGPRDLSRHAE
ncbi:MAG: glycosyltransferase family 2 protein [Terriglobales bacterium]